MKLLIRLPLFVAVTALTIPSLAYADVLGVPGQFGTIQAAINAAQPGDKVLVQGDGEMYGENLVMRAGVSVIGLGAVRPLVVATVGGIPTVSFPDPNTGRDTILNHLTLVNGTSPLGAGILIGRGASPTISGNVIQYQSSEWGAGIFALPDGSPLIEKNIIRDCEARKGGGGVYLLVPGPQTEVNLNQIDHNRAGFYGAGAIIVGGTVQLLLNRFEDNGSERHAGGLLAYGTKLTAFGNEFERNWADSNAGKGGGACLIGLNEPVFLEGAFRGNSAAEGGGLFVKQCNVVVDTVEFTDNRANQLGGGVFATGVKGSVVLSACDLRRNSAGGDWKLGEGGGIFCEGGATLKVVNCVLYSNSAGYAPNSGAGIRIRSAGDVQVVNNTLVHNRINGSLNPGTGLSIGAVAEARVTNNWFAQHGFHVLRDQIGTPVMLQTNRYTSNSLGQLVPDPTDGIAWPRFVAPGLDFHILPADPGVDQGSAVLPEVPTVDMDGQARSLPNVDIGADELNK